MGAKKLILSILPETLAICRLDRDARIPEWAFSGSFISITRTDQELSIVCPQINIPDGVKHDEGWRSIKVDDTLDFSLTGVIASLTMPLAFEGVSVFAISTYDTDYLLVKEKNLKKAAAILSENGHSVIDQQNKD